LADVDPAVKIAGVFEEQCGDWGARRVPAEWARLIDLLGIVTLQQSKAFTS
jgi:hypothetical protein